MAAERASSVHRSLAEAGDPTKPRPGNGQRPQDNAEAKTIVVRDRRKPNQYTTDNIVARDWLPILRVGDAFYFYSVYLSMANRETESSWSSLRTQAEYLQCSVDLIIRGNKLLEICELLYIETGNHRVCNEYFILDPPPLSDELKGRIYQRLAEIAAQETSRNWQAWVAQVRKALDKHRSLPSIWAERRSKKGGRPVKTVRPGSEGDNPSCGSQPELASNGARGSQPGYSWDTSRAVVAHNQGAREPQPEQEQLTKNMNKAGKRGQEALLVVRTRCACLGIAHTVIDVLLENYSLDGILDQLEWLPAREPRDPAAMLISALQGDWSCPSRYDRRQAERVWQAWMVSAHSGGMSDSAAAEVPEKGVGEEGRSVAGRVFSIQDDVSPSAQFVVNGAEQDAREVWSLVLDELRLQMTRATFDTWLGGSEIVAVADGEVTLMVRDAYAAEWLRTRWTGPIQRTLAGIVGQPVSVRFEPREPGPDP